MELNQPRDQQSLSNYKLIKKNNSFFSAYDEQKWLNKQGKKGLLLCRNAVAGYIFKQTESVYTYSVEYMNESVSCPESKAVIQSCVDSGKLFCITKGNFVYYACEGEQCGKDSDALAALKKRFGTLTIFFGALLAFFAALLAYNIDKAIFFDSIKYVVPADNNEILDIFRFVVGHNPAKLFIPVVLAFTLVVLFLFFAFLRDYVLWKDEYKHEKAAEAANSDNDSSHFENETSETINQTKENEGNGSDTISG